MSEQTTSLVSRAFFLGAVVLLALSILEGGARLMGYTILRRTFDPGRLMEYAVVLLVFVVAMLLRQIRDGVKST